MREITKPVYSYAELVALNNDGQLSDCILDKIRARLSEYATDGEWYDAVFELWGNALAEIGFECAKISFSGFWSQGDGASFTCKYVDCEKLLNFFASDIERCPNVWFDGKVEHFAGYLVSQIGGKVTKPEFAELLPYVDFFDCSIDRVSHHYSHENTCRADCSIRGYAFDDEDTDTVDRLEGLAAQFAESVEDLRRDLCFAIYKALENEYNYLTSEESLTEFAEANEYHWDITGHLE